MDSTPVILLCAVLTFPLTLCMYAARARRVTVGTVLFCMLWSCIFPIAWILLLVGSLVWIAEAVPFRRFLNRTLWVSKRVL